ncbi:hypothetical protein PAMP_020593 [Pampus punctatissimus]
MDLFFDSLPSTSQSSPRNGHEDSQMVQREDYDLSREKSLSVSMTEIQEQHTSSSIDNVSRRVQELVEKINHSRISDQKVMDSLQEKLMEKVKEICQQMKEHMYTVYEENSNEMQVKLQELSEVLESCTKLNDELLEACQALTSLREGLAITQT